MRNKLCAFLFFISLPTFALNVSCPTLSEIKSNHLNGWLPLYIDNEELASQQDTEKFIYNVTSLQIARWKSNYLESAHCFYAGTDNIVSKIVLAQDAWRPSQQPAWNWLIPTKFAECITSQAKDCQFQK